MKNIFLILFVGGKMTANLFKIINHPGNGEK
jgi:hypothetical protein